jgi:hypothetical protein
MNKEKKVKKLAEKTIKKTNKEEITQSRAILVADNSKVIALDVVIGIVVLSIFLRFFVAPYFFTIKQTEIDRLYDVIRKFGKEIITIRNIYFLILYIVILGLFFSFNDNEFKKIGLILIISFITSIAVEAKLFVIGALISGIAAYIYIRVVTSFNVKNKNNK